MAIKAVLYDLDGTLLPMDMGLFTKTYFKFLTDKMEKYGFEPTRLMDVIWKGTFAMVMNTGDRTNEEVFWDYFVGVYGEESRSSKEYFLDFYRNEFNLAQSVVVHNDRIPELIKWVKAQGKRQILATNPLFPGFATSERIEWARLNEADFEFYTAYEDCHYCKPNPMYFKEVADRAGLRPEECLMVGNDAEEDAAASKLGMQVFLITDFLINKKNVNMEQYPHGSFNDLKTYLEREWDVK